MPEQTAISGRTAAELAASVEAAIRRGELRPGARLPPIRALAASLEASHVTVAAAYRRLRERGLAVGAGRAGTRVAAQPPLPVRRELVVPPGVRDLVDGNPDPDLLPDLPVPSPRHFLYGMDPRDEELLERVGAAFAADGIPAEHVTIVSGALDGLERLLDAEVRPGDRVAVEDPTFPRVLDLLASLGLQIEPVAIDQAGPRPEALERALRRGVDALILTPRAHRQRWAVVRSFAKGLGPDLRVAALAGDEVTIARVEGRQFLGIGWVSHVLQRTVAAMLSDAETSKRLALAEATYGHRRGALVEALAGHGIPAWGRSGHNVWVPVTEEATVVAGMLAAGYAVAAPVREVASATWRRPRVRHRRGCGSGDCPIEAATSAR